MEAYLLISNGTIEIVFINGNEVKTVHPSSGIYMGVDLYSKTAEYELIEELRDLDIDFYSDIYSEIIPYYDSMFDGCRLIKIYPYIKR